MNEYTPLEQFLYDSGIAMPGDVRRIARKIEGSEWLAAHDAEVRAGVVAEEPEWEYGWHTGSTVSLIGRRDQIDEWLMVRGWKLGEGDWGSRVMQRRVAGTWEVADADG